MHLYVLSLISLIWELGAVGLPGISGSRRRLIIWCGATRGWRRCASRSINDSRESFSTFSVARFRSQRASFSANLHSKLLSGGACACICSVYLDQIYLEQIWTT